MEPEKAIIQKSLGGGSCLSASDAKVRPGRRRRMRSVRMPLSVSTDRHGSSRMKCGACGKDFEDQAVAQNRIDDLKYQARVLGMEIAHLKAKVGMLEFFAGRYRPDELETTE